MEDKTWEASSLEEGQRIVKQQKENRFCGGSCVLLGTAGLSLLQDVNPDTSIRYYWPNHSHTDPNSDNFQQINHA